MTKPVAISAVAQTSESALSTLSTLPPIISTRRPADWKSALRSSADLRVCCIAGFQTCHASLASHALPIWKSAIQQVGNLRHSRAFARNVVCSVIMALLLMTGCATAPKIGEIEPRRGDEIMVAGHYVHTGTPVVLWTDPGGYDAYRVERRFSPLDKADWDTSQAENKDLTTPNRYDLRGGLTPQQIERVRGGGWELETLQNVVDQLVIHFDASGTSRACFKTLQDARGLSTHFLLDLDGTIYQTLDLKERARHATTSNSRSVGIEMANIGAFASGEPDQTNRNEQIISHPFASGEPDTFDQWYHHDQTGRTLITIPPRFGTNSQRTPGFIGSPARPDPITGRIQGQTLRQYDFTPQQYAALIKLTATLCTIFPKIKCDYPRDPSGNLVAQKLPADILANYQGILGHYHIQTNKVDPGPAFQWDHLITNARALKR